MSSKIQTIRSREILDSRGNPTVETEVELSGGVRGIASVPSGASTGTFEACELRDEDAKRYAGKGVLKAVEHVNGEIANELAGKDALEQTVLDEAMNALDGTENKSRLGANAILSVSLAVCRAAALSQKKPLFEYIHDVFFPNLGYSIPIPMFNILNGGQHADSGLSVQEFKVVPFGIESYAHQLRAGSEVFHVLQKKLASDGYATGVGDEGGFAPKLESNEKALWYIREAVREAGYDFGNDIGIGIDVAANSFYDSKNQKYVMMPERLSLTRDEIIRKYASWVTEYGVVSIEDGLEEEDWAGWRYFMEQMRDRSILLIGDDLLVTNATRLKRAIEQQCCNCALIKPNQIGTLTETAKTINMAREAGMGTVLSHRSGETLDIFIADLAVACGSPLMKSGAPNRGERIGKYNRLLEIDEELRALSTQPENE